MALSNSSAARRCRPAGPARRPEEDARVVLAPGRSAARQAADGEQPPAVVARHAVGLHAGHGRLVMPRRSSAGQASVPAGSALGGDFPAGGRSPVSIRADQPARRATGGAAARCEAASAAQVARPRRWLGADRPAPAQRANRRGARQRRPRPGRPGRGAPTARGQRQLPGRRRSASVVGSDQHAAWRAPWRHHAVRA